MTVALPVALASPFYNTHAPRGGSPSRGLQTHDLPGRALSPITIVEAMEAAHTVAKDPTPTTPTLLTGDRTVSHFDRDPFVDA